MTGHCGFLSMARDAGSLSDPLAFYNLHSDDVTAISKAVQLGQAIHASGKAFVIEKVFRCLRLVRLVITRRTR